MPSLNFRKQWAEDVALGKKRQTVRKYRANGRDPKPGDTLYMFTGMRTLVCRSIAKYECTDVRPIKMTDDGIVLDDEDMTPENRDVFARLDGFTSWEEMREFFRKMHGLPFEGLVIYW